MPKVVSTNHTRAGDRGAVVAAIRNGWRLRQSDIKGIRQARLSAIEVGRDEPTDAEIALISRALHVPIAVLAAGFTALLERIRERR